MSLPDMVVFDLDPGAPADLVQCCEVGLLLRGLFDSLGLRCYAKTSGSNVAGRKGVRRLKRRGEQGAPLVSSYGTAAPVPRRRTAKIRLTMARINRMWTHAPICAPDTRPSTQSTSRMTVMVQSISRLLYGHPARKGGGLCSGPSR